MTKGSKRKPLNDPRNTATHEAGHAVISRVLTLDCGGATVVPNDEAGGAGHAITNDPWACIREWERRGKVREPEAVWHAQIMSCMAGAEAEIVLLGATQGGDGGDRTQIALMAEQLGTHDEHWERIEARLRAMTRMLVRRHRAHIERVAAALIKKKRLSREELDRLVGRSVNDVKVNAPFLLAMHANSK